MLINSRLDKLVTLRHKVTVYVPSTTDIDKPIDNAAWVDATAKVLASAFGGATSSPAVGYWVSPSAGLVRENTTVVFAFADSDAFVANVDGILDHCEHMRDTLKQDAIAIEIDNQMYFI